MIRVLQVLPWGLKLGGVETTVMNYCRAIDHTKVQFDFFVPIEYKNEETPFYENEAIALGARIFRHPTSMRHPLKSTFALFRVLKKHPEIKIIHVYGRHSLFPALSLLAARLAGIRVRVVDSCGTFSEYPVLNKLFRPMLRALATHLTASSTAAGVHLFGKKASEKCTISARARDLKLFKYNKERRAEVRNELNIDGNYAIIHIARMDCNKNHSLTLEAFSEALVSNRDMVLMLVGDGELLPEQENKADKLGIKDKVLFLGKRNDVPDLLQAADLLVLPSLTEGLPGVVVEAQAAGLPCLLSDTITTEVKLTDLVEFLPIDKGAQIWAERIPVYRGYSRRDTTEDLRNAGYDIKEAAKRLEGFYYSEIKG
jgi:glycosyltransferase involved in cell wall biosynthesis